MSKDNRLLELLREVRDYLWRLGALKARIEQLDEAIKIVEAGVIRHGNTGAYLGNGVLTVGKGANDRPYLCLDVSTPAPEYTDADLEDAKRVIDAWCDTPGMNVRPDALNIKGAATELARIREERADD